VLSGKFGRLVGLFFLINVVCVKNKVFLPARQLPLFVIPAGPAHTKVNFLYFALCLCIFSFAV